jgi:hypothetical protein
MFRCRLHSDDFGIGIPVLAGAVNDVGAGEIALQLVLPCGIAGESWRADATR